MQSVTKGRVQKFVRKAHGYFTRQQNLLRCSRRSIQDGRPPVGSSGDDLLQTDATHIFQAAVDSVQPDKMVQHALKMENDHLLVGENRYKLDRNVHIAAFGKAVLGMVRAAEDVLGDHVVGGIASVPLGIEDVLRNANKQNLLPQAWSRIRVHEGAANNMPDEHAHRAAMDIYKMVNSLGEEDLCLTLISGGGSALLPAPIPPLTLGDLASVTGVMARAGASIQQLNTVRKHLELLKGGGLAGAAEPAKVVSLIMSDVIGSPLDLIASGPTVHDLSTPQECLDLFRYFKIQDKIPACVIKLLEKRAETEHFQRETTELGIKDVEDDLPLCAKCLNAENFIIGSNEIMVTHAVQKATELGYLPYVLSVSLEGKAEKQGEMLADVAAFVCLSMGNKRRRDVQWVLVQEEMDMLRRGITKKTVNEILLAAEQAANQDRSLCLLAAGETVVNVTGTGRGGRNQELALSASVHLSDNAHKYELNPRFHIHLLSAGTDGQDGPTDAAGAFSDTHTYNQGLDAGMDGKLYIENNDSYTFFSHLNNGRNLLKTGLTGTNVMDLQVLLIKPIQNP